ncbi:MAG TPA: hypothetical protein VD763_14245 [Candidatus Saccharimonadales bacterium]|nr:hypothetical protein [Candidatus Saccharimonadales bacterium]
MRLSDWQAQAPHRDALASKVMTVIQPVLAALGAESDPVCWIAWGDDPRSRYTMLVPTAAGLIVMSVRVNMPQEGPRASSKLIRWARVQVGELAIEMAQGHRLLSFQVEGNVLRGSDAEADAIAAFALELFASMDGRVQPASATKRGRPTRASLKAAASKTPSPTSPAPARAMPAPAAAKGPDR